MSLKNFDKNIKKFLKENKLKANTPITDLEKLIEFFNKTSSKEITPLYASTSNIDLSEIKHIELNNGKMKIGSLSFLGDRIEVLEFEPKELYFIRKDGSPKDTVIAIITKDDKEEKEDLREYYEVDVYRVKGRYAVLIYHEDSNYMKREEREIFLFEQFGIIHNMNNFTIKNMRGKQDNEIKTEEETKMDKKVKSFKILTDKLTGPEDKTKKETEDISDKLHYKQQPNETEPQYSSRTGYKDLDKETPADKLSKMFIDLKKILNSGYYLQENYVNEEWQLKLFITRDIAKEKIDLAIDQIKETYNADLKSIDEKDAKKIITFYKKTNDNPEQE